MAKDTVEFTSDRMRMLAPLLTIEVMTLARERLCGRKFFNSGKYMLSHDKYVAKLALIAVLEMNPYENLSADEEGLMRGIDADTLRQRKKDGLIRPL